VNNFRKFAICLLAMAAFVLSAAAQDVISTVVGGGPNNLPGTVANLYQPYTEAIDAAGNIYVAAYQQHRIFKINTSGVVTVVAGTGIGGYSGDGGPAVKAELYYPQGVAVDTASPANVYIGDTSNCLVRKVSQSTGIITTIGGLVTGATTTACGYSGNGGAATSAEMYSPVGLAVTSGGSVFVAEYNNGVVRKISGGTITLIAGAGGSNTTASNCGGTSPYGDGGSATSASAFLCYPQGIALDSSANVFVTESSSGGHCDVREIVLSSSKLYQVAGNFTCGFVDGVTATSGELDDPWQPWVVSVSGGTTTISVADYSNVRIRQFTLTYSGGVPVPGKITTIAGDGSGGYCNDGDPAIDACMSPVGLVYDSSGNYYIGDYGSDRVRKVTKSTGDISTIFGWGPNGGTEVSYSDPVGVTNVAGGNPSLYYPAGVYADPTSDNVYIGGYDGEAVYKWNSGANEISGFAGDGVAGFAGDGGPAESAATDLNAPWGIARDGSGNVYIGDYNNCVIRQVSASTADITTIAGGTPDHQDGCGYTADGSVAVDTQNDGVSSIAITPAGTIFYADYGNCLVRKIATGTNTVTTVAGDHTLGCGFSGDLGPATAAQIRNPTQIALDSAENLYIADYPNCRIREVVRATGIIKTIAGDASCGYSGDGAATSNDLYYPEGVWSDPNGNIFISDTDNQILRWVTPTGQLTTFAGTPDSNGFLGDGGPALSAKLYQPQQITQDGVGNIYVADQYNQRVRKVTPFAGFGLSTANLSFETQPAGTTSDFQPVTVSAVGPTTISGVTVGTGFSEIDDCAGTSLTAGQTCEIDVYFSPTAAGAAIGTVSIASNAKFATTQLNSVSLSGTASGLTLTGSLAFGSTPVKTPVTQTVTLKNTGATVSLGRIFITDTTDFSISGGTCPTGGGSLATGASCTITVSFSPATTGGKKGTLAINSTDPASPLLAQATGTGVAVKLSTNSVAFGTISYGTTKTVDVTVTNVGTSNLTVSAAAGAPSVTVLSTGNTCLAGVAPGKSCTLPLEFTPSSVATHTVIVTVTTNGGANPTIICTGTATSDVSASTTALSFGTITHGTTLTKNITISNVGTIPTLTVSTAISGTNPGEFTVLTTGNTCGSGVTPGKSCTLPVKFSPAAAAAYSATLTVTTNGGANPVVSLTGTGN
jgi:hypothetical protein